MEAGGSLLQAYHRTAAASVDVSGGNIDITLNEGEAVRLTFANVSGPVSGATCKLRNAATGEYLDSGSAGSVGTSAGTTYDDQDWILERRQPLDSSAVERRE